MFAWYGSLRASWLDCCDNESRLLLDDELCVLTASGRLQGTPKGSGEDQKETNGTGQSVWLSHVDVAMFLTFLPAVQFCLLI